jgi:hypothetical protein
MEWVNPDPENEAEMKQPLISERISLMNRLNT